MKKVIAVTSGLAALVAVLVVNAADNNAKSPTKEEQIARGKHLVEAVGCGDCHSPKKMGPNGPEEEMSLFLSGHPAGSEVLPSPQLPPGPWMMAATGDLTTWSGPWGVSFSRNLTPDKETGLGDWTEQNFIDTLRSGRRMGKGRELLPPMPWQPFSKFSDEELKAIFAYLQSLPAIRNPVPEPLPPAAP
jgi:mono/diheme cytochrome c family protein